VWCVAFTSGFNMKQASKVSRRVPRACRGARAQVCKNPIVEV
jgi:hypothetical protein